MECLESVRQQDYPNLELIVNDDASKDESASVIGAWLAKSPIPHRFLRNQINLGLCRSLNNALSHARGKYISGIAADDVWLPGKLHSQVRRMEQLPDSVGVLYTDALQMDEQGRGLEGSFIPVYRRFDKMPEGNIYQTLWKGNFIPAMTTLIRRQCYEVVGLYDERLYYEDWDMWLRIAHRFEFAYGSEFSARYRIVSTSMMNKHLDRIIDAICQVCLKHLTTFQLDPEASTAARSLLYEYAIASYERKTTKYRHNLLKALRFKPTPGLALRCIFDFCGMDSHQFGRVRGLVRPVKPAAESIAAR